MGFQENASNALAILATGLLAGTFFYGLFNVAPTFRDVPLAVHLPFRIALMGHNSIVVQSLMAAAFLSSVWMVPAFRQQHMTRVLAGIASLLTIATFLI